MLIISNPVKRKLMVKHGGITEQEILECFANRERCCLIDDREDHRTDPPTQWFIGETDRGIKIKVVFIENESDLIIKTAYTPNSLEIEIYEENSH